MLNYKKPSTDRRNWTIYESWLNGATEEELARRFLLDTGYVHVIILTYSRKDAENAK